MLKEKVTKLHNKGVHAPTDSMSSSFTSTKNSKDTEESMERIKNDVKAVIELMGPNTPHFEQSASISEDSILPNTTSVSRKDTKIEEEDPNYQTDNDFSTIPPDVTINETDLSLMVDNPTTRTNEQCICPPPIYPVNYVYNSECMCPQMADYLQQKYQEDPVVRPKTEKSKFFNTVLKIFKEKKNTWSGKGDYYTINVKQSTKNFDGLPRRLVFDLVDEIPTKTESNQRSCPCESRLCNDYCLNNDSDLHQIYPKNSGNLRPEFKSSRNTKLDVFPDDGVVSPICKNPKFNQKTTYTESHGAARVDVYYFDHGCSNYFRTTDRTPVLATEALAERTEAYTTKFWAELFGTFNIGFSFLTSFILQFLRFTLYTIVRPLTVGIIQLLSDYFFKPMLCAIFNAVIQPILIFLYNIASSIRDFCDPIAEAMGYFIRELSAPIRAFRLVEVKKEIRENCRAEKQGCKRTTRKYNRV